VTLAPRRARLALAAALPLLLAPLTAGAADAATWTHRDARGDVRQYETDLTEGTTVDTRAPGAAGADITRVRVTHRPRTVAVAVDVRDLKADDNITLSTLLRTPNGPFVAGLTREPGAFGVVLMAMGKKSAAISCAGAAASADARTDRILVEIPRSCLGGPRWVRAGAVLSTSDGPIIGGLLVTSVGSDDDVPDDAPETITTRYDDGLRKAGRAPGFSPKVRVG
jgi:hypothetical protein